MYTHTCMLACMHACLHTYIHTYIHTQLIRGNTGTDSIFEEQLVIVKQYLNFRVSDLNFNRRVLSYFGSAWRQSGDLYSELSLLQKV